MANLEAKPLGGSYLYSEPGGVVLHTHQQIASDKYTYKYVLAFKQKYRNAAS